MLLFFMQNDTAQKNDTVAHKPLEDKEKDKNKLDSKKLSKVSWVIFYSILALSLCFKCNVLSARKLKNYVIF